MTLMGVLAHWFNRTAGGQLSRGRIMARHTSAAALRGMETPLLFLLHALGRAALPRQRRLLLLLLSSLLLFLLDAIALFSVNAHKKCENDSQCECAT
jgi:hypothetical protein